MGKNTVQSVRLVDPEEGQDDATVQRLLSLHDSSEGQIRVLCTYRTELAGLSAAASQVFDFGTAVSTDDFVSFSAQYQEYRVKAIRFSMFDVQPNSAPTINYAATFHQVGGTVPSSAEDIADRPDARSLAPGDGHLTLAWLAHGIPEMAFQPVTGSIGYGGVALYTSPAAAVTGVKYTILVKYLIDFRGRK